MPLKTIYIARHGFRLNWQTTIWKSPTGFPRDPPLAGYGEEQANELAAYIAGLPEAERPTAIYSSQYYRCLQTAKPVAAALQLPLFVEPGIQEWYSPVKAGTGLHPRPVTVEELVPYFEAIDPSWSPTFLVTRKGESVPELYRRGEEFMKTFIARVEAEGIHERVFLCSHAATVISLAQALLGDETIGRTLRVGCCTLSIFDRNPNSTSTELVGGNVWTARGQLAAGDFLQNGIQRDWGMVDIEVKDGVVVEDDGVPGTEGEVDIISGPQPWNPRPRSASRM
ncbi:related to TFIIIC subunit, 55 kDa (transcription initiation factor) [Serendipita indica DSM 11827]|uniref:Related to TFIIIC subunit, 55 kDa (Transcription initiation factor) n=1 Tax=Serendipita indica (strain DSM 11827) TaxID=1109443 RepID=G4TCT0_SERID|nr:related to TFIIIC subunit, 55 kDa (transcription initiation factor) [Serendipita indica DSM 11827]